MRTRRRARSAAALATVLALLAGCTDDPPPVVDPAAETPVPAVPEAAEVVLGIDATTGGFNPHTLADLTPVTSAVAGLLLPSAFRRTAAGRWALDETLLESAAVTSQEPFTVTYSIRREAAWSDTAPIAAEDFDYLAEQMRTEPGVVDSAGYQLIDAVASRDGGKTVDVVFRQPYPAWRTLFRHLLPAHLLKDAPGGWVEALDGGMPVSGGPFALTGVDTDRGELVLERNDRYWDTPAGLDRLVLREGTDPALVDTITSGGAQGALFGGPDAITTGLLDATGSLEPAVVPQPVVASVLLRPASRALSEDPVRRAVAAALDREALIATGAASGPAADLTAGSQVLAPTDGGYSATVPAGRERADPGRVAELLAGAGFERGPGGWERGGRPLALVVAAPADRDPYGTLAQRVAAQLRAAGIGATVLEPTPDELFTELLGPPAPAVPDPADAPEEPAPEVDVAVVPQAVGLDAASSLASRVGCPVVAPAGRATAPPNPAGLCDVSLQPLVTSVLTGSVALDDARAQLETALWDAAVVVPLYQQASLLVTTGAIDGVRPASVEEGALDGAQRWRTSDR